MNLSKVINQLRTYATIFDGNVAGAAEFEQALKDTGNLPLPAAYVIPLEDQAGDNMIRNALRQDVTERIGIIAAVDGSADRRGQGAVDGLHALRKAIHGAILNWHIEPDRAPRGIQYGGGHLLSWDRGRVFWMYIYELETYINEDDGFQVTGPWLSDVQLNVLTGDQVIVGDVSYDNTAVVGRLPSPSARFFLTR